MAATVGVQVRVTVKQHRLLKQAAHVRGQSLAAFLREEALTAAGRVVKKPEPKLA